MSQNLFKLTNRRRDSLAVVRSELVHRDLDQGLWLINMAPARRWHGRTLSELEQAGLIQFAGSDARPAAATLTDEGKRLLDP